MSSQNKVKLDFCSYEAAKYACEHWHYSKAIPAGKLVKIGVWEYDKFIGVVIFSRGANNNMLKPFGLKQTDGCELSRIALREHTVTVSRIIAISLKMLKKSNPGLQLVVSYADVDQGHDGKIYQAGNWLYTGLQGKDSAGAFIFKNKKVHMRSIHALGLKQSVVELRKIDPNVQVFRTKGKHRYIMPLTAEMRRKVLSLHQPYPKSAGAEMETGCATSTDIDGSNPIPAL